MYCMDVLKYHIVTLPPHHVQLLGVRSKYADAYILQSGKADMCDIISRWIIGDVTLSMIITAVRKGTGSGSSQTGKPLLRASVEAGNPRAVMRWPSEGNRGTWLGWKRVFWGEAMVCATWKGGWTRVERLWTALLFLSECWRLTMYFRGVELRTMHTLSSDLPFSGYPRSCPSPERIVFKNYVAQLEKHTVSQ